MQGKSYSLLGGLIPERPVSAKALGLSKEVADTIDIAHLTICDVAAEALRHAKMNPFDLPSRNVGVYIGGAGGSNWAGDLVFTCLIEETAAYLHDLPEFQKPAIKRRLGTKQIGEVAAQVVDQIRQRYAHRRRPVGPNLAAHMSAGIINQAFGLTGPYMAIDAACASSLKAMMLAVNALQQGRQDMAIIGGASYCKSDSLVLFSQAHSVSARDSRPFDADADGLVASEGYVAVVLKTLPRALHDGDPVLGVIRGMGISTDGKGKSLWAPRKEGQVIAIHRAYGEQLDLKRLQYIEAHATSTQVGDATELTALYEALEGRLAPGQQIPLGASKGNIGHTLETAGVAGLAKVMLAMQAATIPPAANIRKLNPRVDWKNMPFRIPTSPEPWPEHKDGHPRRAAVNAFGIGGLNVHVVIDQYVPAKPASFYQSAAPTAGARDPNEPIAVIGMGAIYPARTRSSVSGNCSSRATIPRPTPRRPAGTRTFTAPSPSPASRCRPGALPPRAAGS